MKKLFIFIAALFAMFSAAGCETGQKNTVQAFKAEIIEIKDGMVLTEPLAGEAVLASSGRISFSKDGLSDISAKEGDIVEVKYTGDIKESYPASVTAVDWELISSPSAEEAPLASGYITDDFDTAKAMFAAYGESPSKNGGDAPFFDTVSYDFWVWYDFFSSVKKGDEAAVMIADRTDEGDTVLTYAAYVNGSFYTASDFSRDAFNAGDAYSESSYKYIKEYIHKGYVSYYLVNDSSLSYEDIMDGYLSSSWGKIPDAAFLAYFDLTDVSAYIYDDFPLVSAYVKPESISGEGLVLVIENDEEKDASFGSYYSLEKRNGLAWEKLPYVSKENMGWHDISYPVGKKSGCEFTINWEPIYGSLKSGEYRITKSFTMDGEPDMAYIVSAIFEIS